MPKLGLTRHFPSVHSILIKLTGLSFLLVSFFWSFNAAKILRAEDGTALNLAMVFGWHAALIWSGAVGWHLVKEFGNVRRQFRGAIVLAGSVLLTLGSIGASFATIANDVTQSEHTKLKNSREYKSLTGELASLDAQIKNAQRIEESYIGKKDEPSALIASRHVRTLRTQRNSAEANVARLETMSGTSVSSSPADVALGLLRGEINLPTRALAYFWLQLFIAVIVDVIGLSALAIWIEGFIPNTSRTDLSTPETNAQIRNIASVPKQVRTQKVISRGAIDMSEGRPDTGAVDGKNNRYNEAKELIAKGAVSPTFRALKTALQLSQSTAVRYFSWMQEEGVLRRNGNRFEVAA